MDSFVRTEQKLCVQSVYVLSDVRTVISVVIHRSYIDFSYLIAKSKLSPGKIIYIAADYGGSPVGRTDFHHEGLSVFIVQIMVVYPVACIVYCQFGTSQFYIIRIARKRKVFILVIGVEGECPGYLQLTFFSRCYHLVINDLIIPCKSRIA